MQTSGAGDTGNAATAEIKNLIADVEDLVARIADLQDSDVTRVRTQLLRAVDRAKVAVGESTASVRRQALRAASTANDYVHDSPWQAVGIAALVGAVVGILAARRS